MEMTPRLFHARVMHKRLSPRENAFTYSIYYLAIPLDRIDGLPLSVDRPGLLSFYRRDHAARDGGDLKEWIQPMLRDHGIAADGGIMLVAMPRVLGYVFNPVSFWLCLDRDGALRAVLCEVNNTFGETHSYLCAHPDGRAIIGDEWLWGEKFFHVSPFLKREGRYRFRFRLAGEALGIWIDHYTESGEQQLLTALTGTLEPMTREGLRRAFWRYPLVTLKSIALIHWQAVKLLAKGIRYIPKPLQQDARITVATQNMRENKDSPTDKGRAGRL